MHILLICVCYLVITYKMVLFLLFSKGNSLRLASLPQMCSSYWGWTVLGLRISKKLFHTRCDWYNLTICIPFEMQLTYIHKYIRTHTYTQLLMCKWNWHFSITLYHSLTNTYIHTVPFLIWPHFACPFCSLPYFPVLSSTLHTPLTHAICNFDYNFQLGNCNRLHNTSM